MTSLGDRLTDEEVDEMIQETHGDSDVRQCTSEQIIDMPVVVHHQVPMFFDEALQGSQEYQDEYELNKSRVKTSPRGMSETSASGTSDTGATKEKFEVEMEMAEKPVWVSDGWVTVNKRSKQRREQEERAEHMKHEEGVNSDKEGLPRRSGRTRQIFVKVDNFKTVMLDMTLSDKVKDVMRRIQNKVRRCEDDMHVSFEGKVLRGSDEMNACGVKEGSTLHAISRVRGGGVHKHKKQVKRKKKDNSEKLEIKRQGPEQEVKGHVAESDVEEPKPEGGQDKQLQEFNAEMNTESKKEAIIQQFREWGVYETAVAQFAEDSDDDVDQKMQGFLEMLPVRAASNDCTSVAVGNWR